MTGRLVHHRIRSDGAMEPGAVLMSNATGNCWRIETAREVHRRTPDPVHRHTWDIGCIRIPPADVPALDLRLDGPWWRWHAFPPWAAGDRVRVHPFERDR